MTRRLRLPSLRALALWAGTTILIIAVGGFIAVSSGLYNVAASRPHWPIVRWFLEFAMERSVETHSVFFEDAEPPLTDEGMVRLGAGHFEGGCAVCHGAPGRPASSLYAQMLPPPPELTQAMRQWSDIELFWIVKHGLRYTGMPAWTSQRRDDEIWTVVAFLRAMPSLDEAAYHALVFGRAGPSAEAELRGEMDMPASVASCARCHGDGKLATISPLVPDLHGQSQAYLEASLRDYAAGIRDSGIMGPIASGLKEAEMRALAAHYAGLPARMSVPDGGDAEAMARGQAIAEIGLPEADVPACLSCHGEERLARYPALAGQQAAYMAGQLRLWQQGLRAAMPDGALMAMIAMRLTAQQIEDVSLYFEHARPGGGTP